MSAAVAGLDRGASAAPSVQSGCDTRATHVCVCAPQQPRVQAQGRAPFAAATASSTARRCRACAMASADALEPYERRAAEAEARLDALEAAMSGGARARRRTQRARAPLVRAPLTRNERCAFFQAAPWATPSAWR